MLIYTLFSGKSDYYMNFLAQASLFSSPHYGNDVLALVCTLLANKEVCNPQTVVEIGVSSSLLPYIPSADFACHFLQLRLRLISILINFTQFARKPNTPFTTRAAILFYVLQYFNVCSQNKEKHHALVHIELLMKDARINALNSLRPSTQSGVIKQ